MGWLVCSACIVTGWVWLQHQRPHLLRPRLLMVSLCLYLLMTAAYLLAHRLTGKGIDTSVVYHLQTGLAGTGWLDFAPVIAAAMVAMPVSLLLPALLAGRLQRRARQRPSPPPQGQTSIALGALMLCAGWSAHPAIHDLARLGHAYTRTDSSASDSFFVSARADLPPLAEPERDLIWIYLESLESSYLDTQRFPGLTPHLQALQKQALTFTRLYQAEGTGWTIAGMVASQCGVPLLSLADGNALTGADRFMSNATCLGDLLKQRGYQLHHLGGASLVFAGKGAFYRTHGFIPQGLEEITPHLPAKTPQTAWGLHDDTLYRHAWETLENLASQQNPVGLTMLTLDTHHPKGHPSPSCQPLRYGNGRNPMLNAVHCADHLVGRFVEQLRQHPRYQNALVVIASNHLAMPNTATAQLDQGPRFNLLMLLNSGQTPRQIDRIGTTLDTAPTVLRQLGLNVPALGYGRDLLGEAAALA